MKCNPAKAVDYMKSENPDGFHTWRVPKVEQFKERHPVGTKASLALYLIQCRGSAVRTPPLLSTWPSKGWRSPIKARPETRARTNVVTFSGMRAGGSTTAKKPIFQRGKKSSGSPGWIRTSDHSINSRMLYR